MQPAEIIKIIVEIVIIWFLVYRLSLFIKGTRVVPLLRGLVVLSVLFSLTNFLNLMALNWILTKLFAISVIGFLIIFQPEIRRGLSKIGQTYFFDVFTAPVTEEGVVNKIYQSMANLAQKRIGALVAIERGTGLKTYAETGVMLNAVVSTELLNTIFAPLGPLHDGGVIIHSGIIVAAGCIFPLSHNPNIDHSLGTRHRAALGLTEETDAVVIMVSEESGKISLAEGGRFKSDFEGQDISFVLKSMLQQKQKKKTIFTSWRQKAGYARKNAS